MAAYVYILASRPRGALYIGGTTDLVWRVHQHRAGVIEGFSKKYNVHRLVYYEVFEDLDAAFLRERQMKKWNRCWKTELIEKDNPDWKDLYPEIAGQ